MQKAGVDVEIVEGGSERADTVQNALARVKADVDFVAVHDAARRLSRRADHDDAVANRDRFAETIGVRRCARLGRRSIRRADARGS